MPFFPEIEKYIMEQPDINQSLIQDLIWNLSADEKNKFDQLSDEEQQFLLGINPSAREIVDSYQYYRNISVKSLAFGENLPEEVIAQPFPGTELYAKVNSTSGGNHTYDYTEIDLYNPSTKSQTFSMIKEGEGVLILMPKDSVRKVDVDGLIFGVLSGKFDINNNFFRTPADAGVVLLSQGGAKIVLKSGTEISLSDLAKKLGQDDSANMSFLRARTANAESSNWDWTGSGLQRKGGDPEPPECHVECRLDLCEVVCVRG